MLITVAGDAWRGENKGWKSDSLHKMSDASDIRVVFTQWGEDGRFVARKYNMMGEENK